MLKFTCLLFDKKITPVISALLAVAFFFFAVTYSQYFAILTAIAILVGLVSVAKQQGIFKAKNDTHEW